MPLTLTPVVPATLTPTVVSPAGLTLTDATAVVGTTYGANRYGSFFYGGVSIASLTGVAATAGSLSLAPVTPTVLTLTPA